MVIGTLCHRHIRSRKKGKPVGGRLCAENLEAAAAPISTVDGGQQRRRHTAARRPRGNDGGRLEGVRRRRFFSIPTVTMTISG